MSETVKIKMRHLESGLFVRGLRIWAERSANYHVRLGVAKLIRQIEKNSEEPFKQYQDMLREFGTRTQQGMQVVPSMLDEAKAKAWEEQIKPWRDLEIEIESDLIVDGKFQVKLPEDVLNEFPGQCMEDMLDYAEFSVKEENKDEKIKRLQAEIDALKQKETKGQAPA